MLPGKDEYYKCPDCGTLLVQATIMSGNTFGAKFYSDGKQIAPMLQNFPVISKCEDCERIFWLNETNITKNEDDKYAKKAEFLLLADYFKALELDENKNQENEVALRLLIWRLFNDRVRENLFIFKNPNDKQKYEDNIKRLLEIFEPKNQSDVIIHAELFRNIEDFDESFVLINSVSDKSFVAYINAIKDEIIKKNRYTIQIK